MKDDDLDCSNGKKRRRRDATSPTATATAATTTCSANEQSDQGSNTNNGEESIKSSGINDPLPLSSSSKTYSKESDEPPIYRFKAMASLKIKKLKLEAIFHPKFENENQNDHQIREIMLSKVSSKKGYIEVTLKHSGSLVLWSGGQRFYSKNSTSNAFTAVGEILLRQHFAKAWNSSILGGERAYDECSRYIENNRLTVSFEVVCPALGHHGDLPKRDYLMLLAIADRNQERFYSTTEIIAFAHKFRLPHNDVWIFRSVHVAKDLFQFYDSVREIGMASDVIGGLNEIADGGIVKSMYPHSMYQGEILEGIVIRYVSYNENGSGGKDGAWTMDDEVEQMNQLCLHSERILQEFSSIESNSNDMSDDDQVCQRLFHLNLGSLSENDCETTVQQALQQFHGSELRTTLYLNDRDTGIDVVEVARDILNDSEADFESRRIAELIQTLDGLKVRVTFKILSETKPSRNMETNPCDRYICIVHVHHDETFQKYYRVAKHRDIMSLYRGFSFELISGDNHTDYESEKNLNKAMGLVRLQSGDIDEKNDAQLMLKMKFLPYMVRTFICRNGLSIMEHSTASFENYALGQLIRWGISQKTVEAWMPFLRSWAQYCQSPPSITSNGVPLPILNSKFYLHHYNEFSHLFDNGHYREFLTTKNTFRGLVVTVGVEKSNLMNLATFISNELVCTRIVTNINDISQEDMLRSIQRSGGGLLCTAEITDGVRNLRNLSKIYENSIYVVMAGCSVNEIESLLIKEKNIDQGEVRKIVGMSRGWRNCKCSMLLDLPYNVVLLNKKLCTENSVLQVIDKLKTASASFRSDDRPGLIVFFPTIPGSGKSSLCHNLEDNLSSKLIDRKIIVREGDKTQGKYYLVIEKDTLDNPASMVVIDKNVPPMAWQPIKSICTRNRYIAAAVFPEGMSDTVVRNGNDSYVFPFTLAHLAVCMSRVLSRPPNSHSGKLDSGSELACMIVVKFFCFYKNRTCRKLEQSLHSIGPAPAKVIRVPFFKDATPIDLPSDLYKALSDAVILQTIHDLSSKQSVSSSDEMKNMESKLRMELKNHEHFLHQISVDVEVSRLAFQSQLCDISTSLEFADNAECKEFSKVSSTSRRIKIFSLDVQLKAVHDILASASKQSAECDQFLTSRIQDKCNHEENKSLSRFITSTHCTFAHCCNLAQTEMYKRFSHLIGVPLKIHATAILFSDSVAALEVSIPSETASSCDPIQPIPKPINTFHHITIWCAKGVAPFESNQLPKMVESGEATKVVFESPKDVEGVFGFWYEPCEDSD
jgi:hypothetical protein